MPPTPGSPGPTHRSVGCSGPGSRRNSVLAGCRGFAGIRDSPDRAARILGDQQRAVLGYRHADGPAPDLRIVNHEAGGEIVVFAGRHAVVHDDADDLVSGALRSVPRPMLGGECVAAVAGRKL